MEASETHTVTQILMLLFLVLCAHLVAPSCCLVRHLHLQSSLCPFFLDVLQCLLDQLATSFPINTQLVKGSSIYHTKYVGPLHCSPLSSR